jgi:uncharacterized membrane protein YedE/YeeE
MNFLIYGLLTGICFGFLLQRAGVVRYDKQIGALRFLDMTIVKFMLSSILVGMVGIHLLKFAGLASFVFMPTILSKNIIGGLLFGIGWGLLGYCPGTQGGALGEGRWDSVWGIMGMTLSAAIYAEVYPFIEKVLPDWGDYGKITLPQVLNLNEWLVIALIIVGVITLFRWFEKKGL